MSEHGLFESWVRKGMPEMGRRAALNHAQACHHCKVKLNADEFLKVFFEEDFWLSDEDVTAMGYAIRRAARQHSSERNGRRGTVWLWRTAGVTALTAGVVLLIGSSTENGRGRAGLPFTQSIHVRESLPQPSPSPSAAPLQGGAESSTSALFEKPITRVKMVESPIEPTRVARRAAASKKPSATHDQESSKASLDATFALAWECYRNGDALKAAAVFDHLLEKKLGDQRADILYWSAQAHERAGHFSIALSRLKQLQWAYPGSWHTMKLAVDSRRKSS